MGSPDYWDGISLTFSSRDFLEKLGQEPIKVFEIIVLFDQINLQKSWDHIIQNPGIGIEVESRDPARLVRMYEANRE